MKNVKLTLYFSLLFFWSPYSTLCQDDEENASTTPTTADEDGEESDATVAGPLDYSQLMHLNATSYPTGGIVVQFTENGLMYIVGMAEKATLKVMREFPIPDTEDTGYSVKNVKVLKFSEPKLKARFINQTGIEILVLIPQVETSCDYSAGVGWFSTSGTVKSNIEGLVISMLIRVVRAQNGYPSLMISLCSGKVDKFRVLFENAGMAGTLLNTLRGVMETLFVTSMGNVFCFAARNLTGLIDTVFLDFDKPMSEILKGAVGQDAQQVAPQPGALDMKVICGDDKSQTEVQKPPAKRKGAGGIASSVISEMEELTLDLKMNEDGYFENDEVVLGLRAEFLHAQKPSGLHPRAFRLQKTDRSMCFAVSQIVPNSFSVQGQNNGYFVIKKKLDVAEFPLEIRVPLAVICPRCSMQFYATTIEAPKVEFSTAGVRSISKVFVRIDGRGIFKVRVVEASADVEALVNLSIKNNVVYGDVSLGTMTIKVHNVGLGGIVDKPVNALLRKLIPKIVWPIVQKQLNKHLKEKGFKLPAVCGLTFNNSQIIYLDQDVVVCTDVVYDLDGFLNRFTEWQRKQNEMAAKNRTTVAGATTTVTEQASQRDEQVENEVTVAEAEAEEQTTRSIHVLSRSGDGLTL